jgi:hypothetical protein
MRGLAGNSKMLEKIEPEPLVFIGATARDTMENDFGADAVGRLCLRRMQVLGLA